MLYLNFIKQQNVVFSMISRFIYFILFWAIFLTNGAISASNNLDSMFIGEENAPVTIVEYRSLTCSHCADFANDVFPALKEKYIDSGQVRFELRPFALNAVDLNAFKLLRCVDAKDFFALDKVLFQNQKKWIVTNQSDRVLENSTKAISQYGSLFGLSKDEINACINDDDITDYILTMRIDAVENFNITSTPSFLINGELYEGNMPFKKFEKIIDKLVK